MKRLIKNQKKSKLELEVQTFTLPVVYRHASADTYWKIFLTILKHQNERDLTKSLLSKEIGVSPSLVSRVIRHLTQLGLVKTEENYEIDGTSKMYLAVRTERIVYLLMMDRIND
ncbi:MAG: MarR family transcriptional regulator, partial [Candidatus Odinarchaeota archaeon]